jgi:DNA-binding transcriptional regulator YdaS (Cro superfamily)
MAEMPAFYDNGTLETPRQVIEALGGRFAVARMMGLSGKTVSHWQTWMGYIPAKHYVVITNELAKRGLRASEEVWKMTEAQSA